MKIKKIRLRSRHNKVNSNSLPYKYIENILDVSCTEKSINQEVEYNQITFTAHRNVNKNGVKLILKKIFPSIEINKVRSITLKRVIKSRAMGRVIDRVGSKNNSLNGHKRFIISIYNPESISEGFNKDHRDILKYINNQEIIKEYL